ncbi:MAG: hypothetical protein KJ052_08960 [Candidatus Hydrogenedentes bacterium]|nr:hypothetical protein [Candidatus Hydrogenedentota bacterium]
MAAGDFYFAINATFRFIHDSYGKPALIAYWQKLGAEFFAPLADRFRAGGLSAVAEYWREFFDNEPGGDVEVTRHGNHVEIDVRDCPAIRWLNDHKRDIMPCYCEHCFHVSNAIATKAGMTFELEGGGGTCRQFFHEEGHAP